MVQILETIYIYIHQKSTEELLRALDDFSDRR